MSATRTGKSDKKRTRAQKLEAALEELLAALERQHYAGRAPGRYQYSLSVRNAMLDGRALVHGDDAPPPLLPEDEARAE